MVEFDEARGLGTVAAGEQRFPFHCTQLLDGTRTVDVGAAVSFDVAPGGMGRWEAVRIAKR